MRGLMQYYREQEVDTDSTAATPASYEEAGRQYLLANLEDVCGLRVVQFASAQLLRREIFYSEWDFRAPVNCLGAGARNATKSHDFIIYHDHEAYLRPPKPARSKPLTPSIIGDSARPIISDFMAIFEMTVEPKWVKRLVPRIEQRLMVTLDRARAMQAAHEGEEAAASGAQPALGILDVVAVIGVVSPTSCQRSMPAHVTRASTPLLFALLEAGRFVFIRQPYAGSPRPKSVGARCGSELASVAGSPTGSSSSRAAAAAGKAAGGAVDGDTSCL